MTADTSATIHITTASADPRARLGWRAWLLVGSIAVVVCCFQLGHARTLTEHEIQVGGGARQMAIDHDWLFPKIGDHLWLEKPPLVHWLAVASAAVLGGFSEAAVRLPSAVAGVLVVVLMTSLGVYWFGSRIGIFTGIVQATTVYFITFARLAEPDMILTAIIVSALFVFVRLHSIGATWPRPPRYLALFFWVLVGLSNMVKGLGFGPFVILAPCLTYLIVKRDRSAWRRMISWPGILLAVMIALAWPLAVLAQVPEGRELWRSEIAKRATGGAGYQQPWWYYLETAPWQLLPWTAALLIAAGPSLNRARREPHSPDRFIWIWALVPIVLLSFFRGKHHHYIMSSLCAFSPLCAIGLLRFGIRIATATVAVAVIGILYVHAYILPAKDRCRDDVEFMKSVRTLVPPDKPLGATGGQEIARAMFYVDPPPQGVFDPHDLDRYFAGREFYLISRLREERNLAKFGRVEVVSQSKHTRAERNPSDRFTLFHVKP